MNHRARKLLATLPAVTIALSAGHLGAKEARPPEWSRDVLDTFFDDARKQLVGARPEYGRADVETSSQQMGGDVAAEPTAFAWSKIIAAEAIETEVKRLSQAVSKAVANASEFKGGGYKDARRDLSELAVLFAVTAQHDGDTRWKDAAAGFRDRCAAAAKSARVGTDESLRSAAATSQVLSDLIRGDRPPPSKTDKGVADWSQISAREPLMQRLHLAHQERLTPWLADAASFRRKQTEVAHEAAIVALLAEVIHRPAFEFSDDDTFVEYAHALGAAATELSTAAAAGNFDQARQAQGRATKSCADCHDGYRG